MRSLLVSGAVLTATGMLAGAEAAPVITTELLLTAEEASGSPKPFTLPVPGADGSIYVVRERDDDGTTPRGVYELRNGVARLIAGDFDDAPGAGGSYSAFGTIDAGASGAVFSAGVFVGPGTFIDGVFAAGRDGTVVPLALTGRTIGDVRIEEISFDGPLAAVGGGVAFVARTEDRVPFDPDRNGPVPDDPASLVVTDASGGATIIASGGQLLPGENGGNPSFIRGDQLTGGTDGSLVYGISGSGRTAVYNWSAERGSRLIGVTDGAVNALPGQVFNVIDDFRADDEGGTFVTASVRPANGGLDDSVILYTDVDGDSRLVLDLGEAVPSEDGGALLLSGIDEFTAGGAGLFAFTGGYREEMQFGSGQYGLFGGTRDGDVQLLLSSGDLLEVADGDVREVLGFNLAINALAANGTLAFRANFTDGTSGIFSLQLGELNAVPVPPSAVLFASALLLYRRSSRGSPLRS